MAYCGASLEVPDLMPPPPDHVPVPAVPLWLGASGLIPFILLAGALWISPVDYHPVLHDWIRTYAAVILSFIGAIHWGVAMVHRDMAMNPIKTRIAKGYASGSSGNCEARKHDSDCLHITTSNDERDPQFR